MSLHPASAAWLAVCLWTFYYTMVRDHPLNFLKWSLTDAEPSLSLMFSLKTQQKLSPCSVPGCPRWATSQLWVATVSTCLFCFVFDTLVTGGALGQQEGGGRGQVRRWHQNQLLHGLEGGKLLQPKTRHTATTTQSVLTRQREPSPAATAKPKVNALNFFFSFRKTHLHKRCTFHPAVLGGNIQILCCSINPGFHFGENKLCTLSPEANWKLQLSLVR